MKNNGNYIVVGYFKMLSSLNKTTSHISQSNQSPKWERLVSYQDLQSSVDMQLFSLPYLHTYVQTPGHI